MATMLRLSGGALFALMLLACEPASRTAVPGGETPSFQESLPFQGAPFDILADDVDGNGRPDIVLVSHGGDYAEVFFQKEHRAFVAGPQAAEVGFHPGDIIRWPSEQRLYLVAAEGVNRLRVLEPEPDGGFREVSHRAERVPRYVASFRWPQWGVSLAVTPFHNNALVLLRDVEPRSGRAAARVPIQLDRNQRSLRRAERVAPVDIDGDGVDELLFASPITQELLMLRYPGGDESITPVLIRKFPAGAPNQVAAADLNADGAPDLIVPNQSKPFQINILMNDGGGAFADASPLSFPTTMGIRRVAVGKDRDGANYLLAVGYGAVALYRFPASWDGRAPVAMRSVPMARNEGSQALLLQDIDGDGWLDGIVGRGGGDNGVWLVYGPLWEHFDALATEQFVLR